MGQMSCRSSLLSEIHHNFFLNHITNLICLTCWPVSQVRWVQQTIPSKSVRQWPPQNIFLSPIEKGNSCLKSEQLHTSAEWPHGGEKSCRKPCLHRFSSTPIQEVWIAQVWIAQVFCKLQKKNQFFRLFGFCLAEWQTSHQLQGHLGWSQHKRHHTRQLEMSHSSRRTLQGFQQTF